MHLNIFFWFLKCLLIFLILSFEKQIFLFFMKSNSFFFFHEEILYLMQPIIPQSDIKKIFSGVFAQKFYNFQLLYLGVQFISISFCVSGKRGGSYFFHMKNESSVILAIGKIFSPLLNCLNTLVENHLTICMKLFLTHLM